VAGSIAGFVAMAAKQNQLARQIVAMLLRRNRLAYWRWRRACRDCSVPMADRLKLCHDWRIEGNAAESARRMLYGIEG